MIKLAPLTILRKKALPIFMAFCLVLSLAPSQLLFADDTEANKLFFVEVNSNSASYQGNIGSSFKVKVGSVAVNGGGSSGSAIGAVVYPASMLSVTGITTSGSAYGTPTINQGNGTVNFNATRGAYSGASADVFWITFKVMGAGSGKLVFSSNSKVNNSPATIRQEAILTLVNPNPPPSKPSTPKPSAPSTSPTPAPQITEPPQTSPDLTGLVSTVSVNPLYSSSTVSWRVNANNPKATLSYGTNSVQLDKQAAVTQGSDGTFTAKITDLTPGLRYVFTIAATGDGGKNGAYSGTISMRGYPVSITITENNQPVQRGQVKIGNQTALITTPGKLTIGLAAGKHSGTITTDTATTTINLTVAAKTIPIGNGAPDTQTFSFNLTSSNPVQGPGSGFAILAFIGVLFGGLVVLGLGFVGFMSFRRRRFETEDSGVVYRSGTPTVVIDDGYNWQSQQSADHNNSQTDSPTPVPAAPGTHRNSVHLSEEEPLDMFEKAGVGTRPASPPSEGVSENPPETEHNPNPPHSTTP